ncbi:hypothetical protein Ciccas_008925 [Cichlidogyrus casuarinus]|uniref:Uncharacterized protein n=1 Tax=Cichlidogyrus casuarinus TaxID=1844966 RepID=A0ABD2PYL1_9PLAT
MNGASSDNNLSFSQLSANSSIGTLPKSRDAAHDPEVDRHSSPSRSLFDTAGSLALRTEQAAPGNSHESGPSTKSSSKKASSISGPLLGHADPKSLSLDTVSRTMSDEFVQDQVLSRILGCISDQIGSNALDQTVKSTPKSGGSSVSSVSTPPNVTSQSQGSGILHFSHRSTGMSCEQFNVCKALTMLYGHNKSLVNAMTVSLGRQFSELHEEIKCMSKQNVQQQELISSMNVQLVSLQVPKSFM